MMKESYKEDKMAVVQIDEHNVLLDDEDVQRVTGLKWYVDRKAGSKGQHYFRRCYVVTKGKQSTISLHRFIMGCTLGDGKVVDHINHNTLDCRKANLRICSREENVRNQKVTKRSPFGYKGVRKYHKTPKWFYSRINRRINGKMKEWHLGTYDTAEEAAKAYDKAALFMFGEFAYTNFPKESYTDDEVSTFFTNIYPTFNNNKETELDKITNL